MVNQPSMLIVKVKKPFEREKLIEQLTSLLVDNRNTMPSGIEMHLTRCCGCEVPRIYEDRYKCLECHNYDLCGRCFDQRRETESHKSGHVMVHFSDQNELFSEPITNDNATITLDKFKEKYRNEEHANVSCGICKITPIKGLAFKCDICHNFDICINCMEKRTHDQTHPLLAMGKCRFPKIPMDDFELNDELGRGGFGKICLIFS